MVVMQLMNEKNITIININKYNIKIRFQLK